VLVSRQSGEKGVSVHRGGVERWVEKVLDW